MITAEIKECQERIRNLEDAFNLCDQEFTYAIILQQQSEEERLHALRRIARKDY